MKIHSCSLVLVLSLTSPWIAGAEDGRPVTRQGTSVLHYTVCSHLVATEAGSNVVGNLRIQFNEQGHSQKQSLRLAARGLTPDSSYSLGALLGDETNATPVATLEANGKGRVAVSYLSTAQGNGGRNPLPEPLLPLTSLRAIQVANSDTQTVAYAWVADSSRFEYLVKRNLTAADVNAAAEGSISLIANQRRVGFRLLAGGLTPGSDYHLAVNESVVTTAVSDQLGRLVIKGWPSNAPAVLELRSLSLLDSGSNAVLTTSLPQ